MRAQPVVARLSILLRIESLLVLGGGCAGYHHWFSHHWLLFACLFLVPDLSLIPYGFGANAAATAGYNAAHSYTAPVMLGALSLYTGQAFLAQASLIWISHIALDRSLGYGLKYPTAFKFTHIQAVDAARPADRLMRSA